MCNDIKTIAEIVSHIATILAVVGGGWWFLYTTQFKPRLQFDLDCQFVRLPHNPKALLAELQFIFENQGFVEHRLWNLNVSVHALDAEDTLTALKKTGEIKFLKRILLKTQLVPRRYMYYFVRPRVRQIITHIIEVPSAVSVIRVTASFDYNRDDRFPHTIRRVFQLPNEPEKV
jgi:hypothetical protein